MPHGSLTAGKGTQMTRMGGMTTDEVFRVSPAIAPHDHTLRPRIKCGVTARRPSGCALPYYRHAVIATAYPARRVTPHLMRGLKKELAHG